MKISNILRTDKTLDFSFYIIGWVCLILALVLGLAWRSGYFLWIFPPDGCVLHNLTGYYCPGCGGTRAIYALLHGPKCIIADTDEDDEFKFEAYGFTIDEFNEYVDKCKKLGYIVDELSFDNSYSADNTDGYNVDLDFEEKDCAIRVTIQSPE